jgi:hypothetical protein
MAKIKRPDLTLYTVFAAVSILFVVKLVGETKGKALEDM